MDDKENRPDNWSQEEQRANYIDQTMKFTKEDLERERERLRQESRQRFELRHQNQPLDGDYFDQEDEQPSELSAEEKIVKSDSSLKEDITEINKEEDNQEELEQSENKSTIFERIQMALPSLKSKTYDSSLENYAKEDLDEDDYNSISSNDEFVADESNEIIHHSSTESHQEALSKNSNNDEKHDEVIDDIVETIHDQPGPIVTDPLLDETVKVEIPVGSLVEDELETPLSDEQDDELDETGEDFVGGATWLTVGNIISRVIGALYVIPWATWLGEEYTQANTLYSVGYKPYSLFLAIATAGFPSAIAKQMSYFHSKNEYRVADKLFKYSMLIMLGTGFISGGLLYLLAPVLAGASSTVYPESAVLVIRSLTPALLILPAMSLLRGYFQGFNEMKPTAISQILEQLARVIYLLTATYAIMRVYDGTVTEAVVHSTFAAFIGALIALIYLIVIYFKNQPTINKKIKQSADRITIDFKDSMKLMIQDSIPFILLGSGIIIIQLIDTYTFSQILERTTDLLLVEISELYGALSLDVDKLIMIIVSLAVSMATAAVPTVTRQFAEGDRVATGKLVQRIMLIFLAVMLPAAFGMASIADNVYHFFYINGSEYGPQLLVTGALSSIALGAYTVLSTILQSMNYRSSAVKYLVVAIAVKLVLQFPMVGFFHAHGALLGTMIAFIVASLLMWRKIEKELVIDKKQLINDTVIILLCTALMVLVAVLWNLALNRLFGMTGRFLTFIKICLTIVIAGGVYTLSLGLFGKLSIIVGDKFVSFQEKLRLFE